MNWSWVLTMAWRDSRKNRSKLFLYISSIILGIAALVALNSFNATMEQSIDIQAASLLGADLELSSRTALSDDAQRFVDSISNLAEEVATEQRFVSMLHLDKTQEARLVQVRAVSVAYPFYGQFETLSSSTDRNYASSGDMLVDHSIAAQYNVAVGDVVGLGEKKYSVKGLVTRFPGQSAFAGAMVPSVAVAIDGLEETGLRQVGSRVEYFYYFRFDKGVDVEAFRERLADRLEALQLGVSTIQSTKEATGRSFADVGSFMQLVGFVALLLGAIGVSSAVHVFVREKMVTVATLRCLGASARSTFMVFLVQFAAIGLVGGIVGALLGSLVQYALPLVVGEFLPVEIETQFSWYAVLQGVVLGLVISVLFSLLPLIRVREVSPLNVLRVVEDLPHRRIDRWRTAVWILIFLFILVFARLQLQDWGQTIFFLLAMGSAFGLLFGVAKGIIYLCRRFFPSRWPYVWRQGLSNLFRPQNQTIVVILSVGFGTALIGTLFFVQDVLMQRIRLGGTETQSNFLLFDIQKEQHAAVAQLIVREGLPVKEQVPIVTLQLSAINGMGLEDVLADSTLGIKPSAFRGEIRATYRDSLDDSERLVDGDWVARVNRKDTAVISLEKRWAENIHAQVGDMLTLNVQGVDVVAKVGSLRQVDWNRFQTNFRMVFAAGTLEQAPQFYVMTTRVPNPEVAARLQRQVSSHFPNVSVVDLNALLQLLDSLLQKIGFVIQFIGAFSILTGVVVLISSLLISKYQRLKEQLLLRTIGASRSQIIRIVVAEYLFLGVFSAFSGVLIALIATNLLARFVFEALFFPDALSVFVIVFSVAVLTVLIGVLNSISSLNTPTLEVLRED